MNSIHKVLVVEDDSSIRELLVTHLREAGFHVAESSNGLAGLALAKTGAYDLLVLDLMLPGCSGLDICRELRKSNISSLILMLTERGSELDKVLGLEVGADDYVTKPFSVREIVARVRALFRRGVALQNEKAQTKQILLGALIVDPAARTVTNAGAEIELTATEFDLLVYLAENSGRAFSRTQLLNAVWGYASNGYEATVNTHINRLRAKIEADPVDPKYILTVRGIGYKCATI
jgi:DNA-binding response OmpR family regulator